MSDLILLFSSSLIAATIFPAQSEIILAYLTHANEHSRLLLLLVATTGNVLGALINWFLGYYVMRFKDKKWFPISSHKIEKYSQTYEKWGIWSLLLAWVPIIGDPLTLIAGMFKTNIWLFLLLVTIGKAARYVCIMMIF